MIDLRPKDFDNIVGQSNLKECLRISIQSAKERKDVLNHILMQGKAGTGKTTFALAIGNEVNTKVFLANGGNIKNSKDVLPYLVRLQFGNVLFIDEIHRVHTRVQEALFTVMEDFRFDLSKNLSSIELQPFTLIGATTESGLLLRPFYDRFVHKYIIEEYSVEDLSEIVNRNSKKLNVNIDSKAIYQIATRSRFTPRIANSLLLWCRDYAFSLKSNITFDIVKKAMDLKKIDEKGLDDSDRLYINVLESAKKPLGLNTLVGMTGLSKETIEQQIEPYLLKLGMIDKSQKGRILLKGRNWK